MIGLFRWGNRSLDEILNKFETLDEQLEEFQERNQRDMAEKLKLIEQLQTEYDRQVADSYRARIVQMNIQTILTQQIATDPFDQEHV